MCLSPYTLEEWKNSKLYKDRMKKCKNNGRNEDTCNKIREDDTFNLIDLDRFSVGRGLILELIHSDSSSESIECDHTFNEAQIEWFKAGSALNLIRTSQ